MFTVFLYTYTTTHDAAAMVSVCMSCSVGNGKESYQVLHEDQERTPEQTSARNAKQQVGVVLLTWRT